MNTARNTTLTTYQKRTNDDGSVYFYGRKSFRGSPELAAAYVERFNKIPGEQIVFHTIAGRTASDKAGGFVVSQLPA